MQLKYGYSEYHFLWISGIKYTYLFWRGIFGYFGEFFSGILVYHYPPWPTLITWYGRYPFSVNTSQCTKKKSFEGYFSWILFSKNEFFTVTDGLNYIRIPRLQQVQYIISGPTFTFSLFICTFFKLKRLYVCTFMSCAGRPSVLVHLTTSVSKWYKYYQSWADLSWIFSRLFPWGPDSNVLFIWYLVFLVWEKQKQQKRCSLTWRNVE